MKILPFAITGIALHAAAAAALAAETLPGRLLASQCAQCHGTNGQSKNGIDSIAGKNANDLYSDLREMKAKTDKVDIMHQQAKGYTDAELRALANYLSTVPGGGDD